MELAAVSRINQIGSKRWEIAELPKGTRRTESSYDGWFGVSLLGLPEHRLGNRGIFFQFRHQHHRYLARLHRTLPDSAYKGVRKWIAFPA